MTQFISLRCDLDDDDPSIMWDEGRVVCRESKISSSNEENIEIDQ
jgi:hypothetical protein